MHDWPILRSEPKIFEIGHCRSSASERGNLAYNQSQHLDLDLMEPIEIRIKIGISNFQTPLANSIHSIPFSLPSCNAQVFHPTHIPSIHPLYFSFPNCLSQLQTHCQKRVRFSSGLNDIFRMIFND
ncbi:hypothetical protein EYC84_004761 [Monilinia fructicola]|uniref:Uncharacterized protein n=1 Tax=Monilinia fructicola TaxID=38448 RepID=A0A5M9K498_MONFR|nr:hypothetical protein EYC84_004761 [Monilinia fructicola]